MSGPAHQHRPLPTSGRWAAGGPAAGTATRSAPLRDGGAVVLGRQRVQSPGRSSAGPPGRLGKEAARGAHAGGGAERVCRRAFLRGRRKCLRRVEPRRRGAECALGVVGQRRRRCPVQPDDMGSSPAIPQAKSVHSLHAEIRLVDFLTRKRGRYRPARLASSSAPSPPPPPRSHCFTTSPSHPTNPIRADARRPYGDGRVQHGQVAFSTDKARVTAHTPARVNSHPRIGRPPARSPRERKRGSPATRPPPPATSCGTSPTRMACTPTSS